MTEDLDRTNHLVGRALAVALDIMSRAHRMHQPASDLDDMAELYLQLYPRDWEREVHAQSVRWLLAGGLDLRERPFDPLTVTGGPGSPEPAPGGGERIAA